MITRTGAPLKKVFTILLLLVFLASLPLVALADDFTFSAMCDTRGRKTGVNDDVVTILVNHMMKNNPDIKFMVFPGDMVAGGDGTGVQLAHWKEIMAPVYTSPKAIWPKIWPAIGNHEVKVEGAQEEYLRAFPDVFYNGPDNEKGLTYSFDYDNVHFVALTTDRWIPKTGDTPADALQRMTKTRGIQPETLQWLDADLIAARKRGARYIFVFGHQPAFPISDHIDDALPMAGWTEKHPGDRTYIQQRDNFWQILKKHKVSAYICGHEHLYGRLSVDGVYQILTGGGGAPTYDPNPTLKDREQGKKTDATYDENLPYYEILGYPHGPDDNCQASKDFVGGKFFDYTIFHVTDSGVRVKVFGVEPKEGTKDQLPDNYSIRQIDEFLIKRK